MLKDSSKNLTEGSLFKGIILFGLPLIATNLLQILFNMADLIVVGNFSGTVSLGSVGSTVSLIHLYTGFLIGIGGGINSIVARYFGAGDDEGVKKAVHTSGVFCLITGIITFAISASTSYFVLRLLGTKPEYMEKAVTYIVIYSAGLPALSIYNFGNGVLGAVGDTKNPLIYLLVSGAVNVVLNVLFVVTFKMDVVGVALASVISQYLSAFLVMFLLVKTNGVFRFSFKGIKDNLDGEKLSLIFKIGLPSGAQFIIFQIANLFVQGGVNTFSKETVAGNAAAGQFDGLVLDAMGAFNIACASFIAQNYGARKKDRILKSYFISMLYAFTLGAIMGVTVAVFGEFFTSIFVDEYDPAVIAAGALRLKVMGLSFAFSTFMDCTISASRGLGKSIIPTFIVIAGSCIFRIVWIYTVFAYFKSPEWLYLVYIFSWTLTAIAEIIYFVIIYKKLTADFCEEQIKAAA